MLGFDKMKNSGEAQRRSERRDAAENRQRILDTALRLFEQHGVEQVSMNQIAIEAQIGPGTLYRRYSNKSELCLDLIKDNIVLLFDDIEAYLNEHRTDPPRERLRGVISLFIGYREKKLQLLTGVEEGVSTSGSLAKKQRPGRLHDELHEIFVSLLDEMNGDNAVHASSVFKADLLISALKSDFYVFQRDVRGHTSDAFLEQICSVFLDG